MLYVNKINKHIKIYLTKLAKFRTRKIFLNLNTHYRNEKHRQVAINVVM